MLANYSDELFTTQPQLSEVSGAAGEMLTKIHKITINSGLVLRIQDQWPDWARLQTSCSASFSSSGFFNLTIQIFCMMAMASLKVV